MLTKAQGYSVSEKNFSFIMGDSMGYIHCCGTLQRTRTYKLVPQNDCFMCEVDVLSRCSICGHKVVQLSKISFSGEVSTIRKTNRKAEKFFKKIKKDILYEIRPYRYNKQGKFYLNYNEYGVIKKCYSNLRNLKLGKSENLNVKTDAFKKV